MTTPRVTRADAAMHNAEVQPQPGIFASGASEHCYVEFDLLDGADPLALVVALAELHGPETPLVATSCVVGVRPEVWARVAPDDAPPNVRSFERIVADEYAMPATQHDAWLWIAGSRRDTVFDAALAAIRHVASVAGAVTEVTAWSHQQNRDLTGFIDGTENPSAAEAPEVALVEAGPGAGSSVLLFQQWEHFASWEALDVAAQQAVIGRTKLDSVELPPEVMPVDSHVARNVIEEDGEELAIFRRNTAYGGPTEHGTMFVGFCATQHPLQAMLESMAGVPDGIRDALTRYATVKSGAYYVVPSLDALTRFLPPEEA